MNQNKPIPEGPEDDKPEIPDFTKPDTDEAKSAEEIKNKAKSIVGRARLLAFPCILKTENKADMQKEHDEIALLAGQLKTDLRKNWKEELQFNDINSLGNANAQNTARRYAAAIIYLMLSEILLKGEPVDMKSYIETARHNSFVFMIEDKRLSSYYMMFMERYAQKGWLTSAANA